MEKRVKNLFAEQEPPAYISNIEVDAMKARIKELEMELAGQQKEAEPVPALPEDEIVSQPSLPSQPSQLLQHVLLSRKEIAQPDVPPSNVGRQKQIVLWLIGICTIVDLALSIYLVSSIDSVRQGQFDLIASLFIAISAVVLISNLSSPFIVDLIAPPKYNYIGVNIYSLLAITEQLRNDDTIKMHLSG